VVNENRKALSRFRLEQAIECLKVAEILADTNHYKDAANRSYYCIFHSMRAILALDGFDSKKHSGVISAFRRGYIKTGKFLPHFSDVIRDAFNIRTDSDYEDFYFVTKPEVIEQLESAKIFLEAVEKYIDNFLEAKE